MDINYFMKIQNAYGVKNKREKELIKVNQEMSKHFGDTFDTEKVFINGIPTQLMIIKDTEGNTFKKKIKSVHGNKFNLGDYVEWNNQIWLITLVDVDEKTWNRGYMYLCTVPLRWQNSQGKIVERWAYVEDFTKYSNGIIGNNTISTGDNQYGLTLPIDSETKKLRRDMRFSMDFDDSEEPDIYKLTNRKVKLNDNRYFGRGGTMIIIMSFDAFNKNEDKKIVLENGQEAWICNYSDLCHTLPPSPNEMTDLTATISGNPNLKNSYWRTYSVTFKDKDKNPVDWADIKFKWNIISDFDIKKKAYENKIELFVDDEDLVFSKSFFILQVAIDNKTIEEFKISIVE